MKQKITEKLIIQDLTLNLSIGENKIWGIGLREARDQHFTFQALFTATERSTGLKLVEFKKDRPVCVFEREKCYNERSDS